MALCIMSSIINLFIVLRLQYLILTKASSWLDNINNTIQGPGLTFKLDILSIYENIYMLSLSVWVCILLNEFPIPFLWVVRVYSQVKQNVEKCAMWVAHFVRCFISIYNNNNNNNIIILFIKLRAIHKTSFFFQCYILRWWTKCCKHS